MNGTPEAAESFWINKQQHILSISSLCVGIWSKTLITLDLCKKRLSNIFLTSVKALHFSIYSEIHQQCSTIIMTP